MSVHSVALFSSISSPYSPTGTFVPPMTSGASVFNTVVVLAPARQSGVPARTATP